MSSPTGVETEEIARTQMGVETEERSHTWERTRSLTGEQTEDVVQVGDSKDQMGVETVDRSHT